MVKTAVAVGLPVLPGLAEIVRICTVNLLISLFLEVGFVYIKILNFISLVLVCANK